MHMFMRQSGRHAANITPTACASGAEMTPLTPDLQLQLQLQLQLHMLPQLARPSLGNPPPRTARYCPACADVPPELPCLSFFPAPVAPGRKNHCLPGHIALGTWGCWHHRRSLCAGPPLAPGLCLRHCDIAVSVGGGSAGKDYYVLTLK